MAGLTSEVRDALAAAPDDERALLELRLGWTGLSEAQARIAARMRAFLLTWDPLEWVGDPGQVGPPRPGTATPSRSSFICRRLRPSRVERGEGTTAAVLGKLAGSVLAVGARHEQALVAGIYAQLVRAGEAPSLLCEPGSPAGSPAPELALAQEGWEPIGLGAIQDLVLAGWTSGRADGPPAARWRPAPVPGMAWAVLLLASGHDGAAEDAAGRAATGRACAPGRATIPCQSMHSVCAPGQRWRNSTSTRRSSGESWSPDMLATGISAGDAVGLVGPASAVEVYAPVGRRQRHRQRARSGSGRPVRVRWVPDAVWPLLGHDGDRRAPRAAVLLDLLEGDEPRARREAARALASMIAINRLGAARNAAVARAASRSPRPRARGRRECRRTSADHPEARGAAAVGKVPGRMAVKARDEGVRAGSGRPVGEAVLGVGARRLPARRRRLLRERRGDQA